jgi:DMSO/TMAO reductase YedYZ heme-binding membrane subunit
MTVAADPRLIWYVARAAGLVAWGLSAATVLWGLALSTRALGRRPKPAWLADLHRFLGGLTVVFTVVHVAALALDDYVQFTLTDLLVPLAADWRPLAVAWGIVSLYLLLAIEITSLLRRRVSTKLWRRVHQASFMLFATATVHLLIAGSDATEPWLRWTVLLTVTAAVYLSAVRVLTPRRARRSTPARPTSTPERAVQVRTTSSRWGAQPTRPEVTHDVRGEQRVIAEIARRRRAGAAARGGPRAGPRLRRRPRSAPRRRPSRPTGPPL